jgi:hypothetical protein
MAPLRGHFSVAVGFGETHFACRGKVIEVVTLPLIRSLTFRAILAGCAKALES